MLHDDRRRAESFGAAAERYDRSRPSYPAELIDMVVGEDPAGLRVLDVGCGTGIAARLMAARGASVLGVEVDERMAEVARQRGTPVEVSTFEEWDPRGRRFDRVTAAQAWHWVDPERGARRAAEVLVEGGALCAWWNVARENAELAARTGPIYARLAPEAHAFSVMLGTTTHPERLAAAQRLAEQLAALAETAPFERPITTRVPWRRTYTRDEWLEQLSTHSDHLALDPAVLDELLSAVASAINELGGSFEMSYDVVLVRATRRADTP